MRSLVRCVSFAVALLGAARATAQPVTHPEDAPCKVTIVLAPPDVRAEIEGWVRAEPRCERELEVRVVPTDDGLYLSARDQHGRTRERVVPDAQSAAVLVVSWMADDSLGPDLVEPEVPSAKPTIVRPGVAVAPVGDDAAAIRIAVRASREPRGPRLSVGVIGSLDGAGVRGQLDLFGRGRLRIGVAGGVLARDDAAAGQARLVLGTSRSFGRFSLRAQLGVGADLSSSGDMDDDDDDRDEMEGARSVVWVGEAAIFAGVRMGETWGLVGGPLVQASPDDDPTLSVFVGVERGL